MRSGFVLLFSGILLLVTLLGCSGGSGGPAAGTPEWYWQAAIDTFNTADFRKTEEHLGELVKKESPWTQRAMVWRAVVQAGLAQAYKELGDALDEGSKEAESLAPEFRNPLQQYRRRARNYAISLTESMGSLRKALDGAETVTFDFSFPGGSPNPPPLLASVRSGQAPQETKLLEAEADTVKRGILLQTARLAGAGDDTNRARSLFESTPVEVPKTTFLWELGGSIFDLSELFDKKHLNEPKVRKVMLNVALDCITPALEASDEELKEQAEELKEEIEKHQKELPV